MSAIYLFGLRCRWVPIGWCPVCEIQAAADHTCDLTRHPGTDALIADLRKPAAAADTAAAETTPTT